MSEPRSTASSTPIRLDYTYTRGRGARRASCAASPRGSSSASAARRARRSTCRRAAPARRCARADRAKRCRSPTRAPSRRSASSTSRSRDRPCRCRTSLRRVLLDGADIPFFHLRAGVLDATTCAWACACRRCGCRRTSCGPTHGEHPLLPPDRRARRAVRLATRSTCDARRRRSSRSRSRRPCAASIERNEVEILMPVVARGDRALRHRRARRSASPCSGSCDYLAGPAVRVRHGARRRRRVAADRGVARRDGRRLGALRGVGAAPARRRRHGARLRVRQVVARRSARRADAAARSVLRRAALARRVSLAALQARALLDAGATHRARPGRGRRAQPARRGVEPRRAGLAATIDVDEAARRAVRRLAAPHARLPADLRRRRRHRARRRRSRARACASARPGSAASTTASSRTRSACATSRARRRRSSPPSSAGVGNGATVDVAELHAPFTHQELILRDALGLGDGVAINPSGGALAANPMMVAGLDPHRRGGARASSTASARAAPSRTRPRARACSRTSSACWRARR